jgi:EF hand
VKFFFVYKTLAHPEITGGYVQPFTLEERLAHVKQAEDRFGVTIPWIVDDMDNRMKHAMGNRPNSEFIFDPAGRIVRKRAWSNPEQVRKDLEELVGKSETTTSAKEIQTHFKMPLEPAFEHGKIERINREKMKALKVTPIMDGKQGIFYAKLRAEIDPEAFETGAGRMYLGFFLDPIHSAHWNNLTEPLAYSIELPTGVEIKEPKGKARSMTSATDVDPREFLLDVEKWSSETPIVLTVSYAACAGESCNLLEQKYELRLVNDKDAGGAKGEGGSNWKPLQFARGLIANDDDDHSGTVSKSEVKGLVVPHFDTFDTNADGELTLEELKAVAEWLNHRHAPQVSPPLK